MASIPHEAFYITAIMSTLSRTEKPGGVMQEQARIIAFDQAGTSTCSPSPFVRQVVDGPALLDRQSVELPQEPTTVTSTVLTHETDFDALAGEWDELVSVSCLHGGFFSRWHWNRVWWRMYAPLTVSCF